MSEPTPEPTPEPGPTCLLLDIVDGKTVLEVNGVRVPVEFDPASVVARTTMPNRTVAVSLVLQVQHVSMYPSLKED